MRRALAAVVVLLSACDPAPGSLDAQSDDAGPLSLMLGTGETSFTPIVEGQTLLLAHGCQGLQHVWTALRATGIANRGVLVHLELRRTSDGVMISSPFDVAITFTPDPSGAFDDLSGLMLVVPTPSDGLATPITMLGTITDRAGRTTSALLHVTLAWGTELCM